ncbi:Epi-isozizaene synthase [Termitomyces sp. J132]|nr:Epi-isozizaene synthase [Termitomyces sp. J132]
MILEKHELFRYLLPELKRLIARAATTWTTRFSHAVHSYHSSQLQLLSSHIHDVIPDLETYLPLRSDLSGLHLLLDLVELTENFNLPPIDEVPYQKLTRLKRLTIDIICCSLDVVAFNNDQVQGNHHNLITVLMTHKNLSLQGAVNLAGSMIKEMFDSFVEIEKALLGLPRSSQTIKSRDISSCVRTLKDYIVGTINWAYETELYFGKKGEEIRTFGWVFLNSATDSQE